MLARDLFKSFKPWCAVVSRACASDATANPLKGSKSVMTGERGINKATLLGRVGRDSEVRGSETNPVTIFPLATSLTLKTRDGEYVQKTEWHRICVFKPHLRDMVATNVKKGDRVYVSGAISYTSFLDKNNQQQKVTSILADEVITVSSRFKNRAKQDDGGADDDDVHVDEMEGGVVVKERME